MKVFCWVLLFLSARSDAFTVMDEAESRFVDPEVAVDVSSSDCGNIGMTSEEMLNLVEEAVDKYWNRIPHCSLKLVRGNVVDIPVTEIDMGNPIAQRAVSNSIGNNRILVGCNELTFAGDGGFTLGAGLIYNNRGLVFINSSEDNVFQRISGEERLAVLAHEIGHAFGLGHSADSVALMYYNISGKIQKKLNTDDFDGCAYLYPHEFPGSCSLAPYLKKEGGATGGNGGIGQIMFVSIFLGFVLVAILGSSVVRLWRG